MIYLLILLISLAITSYMVYINSHFLTNIDITILEFFHSFQTKLNDNFFSIITWFGSLWIIAPLFSILLIVLYQLGLSHMIFPLIVGFAGTIISTYGLKYIFERKRPELFDTIGELPFDPSFPSAHTAQSFIFVSLTILILFHNQIEGKYFLSALLLLLAFLVASSRIYLQVHYFSDIIAAIFIVLIWALITSSLLKN